MQAFDLFSLGVPFRQRNDPHTSAQIPHFPHHRSAPAFSRRYFGTDATFKSPLRLQSLPINLDQALMLELRIVALTPRVSVNKSLP